MLKICCEMYWLACFSMALTSMFWMLPSSLSSAYRMMSLEISIIAFHGRMRPFTLASLLSSLSKLYEKSHSSDRYLHNSRPALMCSASDISLRWSEIFGSTQMPLVKIGSNTKEWPLLLSCSSIGLVSNVLFMYECCWARPNSEAMPEPVPPPALKIEKYRRDWLALIPQLSIRYE